MAPSRRVALCTCVVLAGTLAAAHPATAQEAAAAPAPLPTAAAAAAATAPPATAAPASQPYGPLLKGKSLQPGERGYKSLAWAAAWSFGITILPVVMGGFLANNPNDGVMWTGLALIAAAQSLGPSAGYWYAQERPRFTWWRLALSAVALAAAGYPMYAYTGRLSHYNKGGAAALVAVAVAAESAAVALAAWDLMNLGDAVDRHNEQPLRTPAAPPKLRATVAPVLVPGGGGVGLQGRF